MSGESLTVFVFGRSEDNSNKVVHLKEGDDTKRRKEVLLLLLLEKNIKMSSDNHRHCCH